VARDSISKGECGTKSKAVPIAPCRRQGERRYSFSFLTSEVKNAVLSMEKVQKTLFKSGNIYMLVFVLNIRYLIKYRVILIATNVLVTDRQVKGCETNYA
jgi:hypothetical protein